MLCLQVCLQLPCRLPQQRSRLRQVRQCFYKLQLQLQLLCRTASWGALHGSGRSSFRLHRLRLRASEAWPHCCRSIASLCCLLWRAVHAEPLGRPFAVLLPLCGWLIAVLLRCHHLPLRRRRVKVRQPPVITILLLAVARPPAIRALLLRLLWLLQVRLLVLMLQQLLLWLLLL